ncbi:MAG: PEP/pyruvate-binding domain-containing protein [Candidatus Omnitrophica bacterium]|nr:PEP/pyruvate-binding domain-containing protein [Candidatus Omnitrophota bacterium]
MVTTGIKGLDGILNGLRDGDNVVWQIDKIKDYKDFAVPFAREALASGKTLIYMRFAPHKPLLRPEEATRIYDLDASSGFEAFTSEVSEIIGREGAGACYVFDCLSDLLSAWATDLMIGNFFMVTCPYLFELDTVAYFAILRNRHSFKTVARIRETTQLLVDIYCCGKKYYVHPLKVWNRYSPTMFLPHVRSGAKFLPVTDSLNISKVLSCISGIGSASAPRRNLDNWDILFMQAQEMSGSGFETKRKDEMVDRICRIMITRDAKIMTLAKTSLTLDALLAIKARMIGTGFIGGKTVGMLLARNILLNDRSSDWKEIFEPHDSYYIGSDVFYSYIVENGWWRLRMRQKTAEGYYDAAADLREKMLYGAFPEEMMEKFQQMIEYFGTSPVIVRSSSLLEDSYGSAFAGKYESIFLPNQGPPEQRYIEFVNAVRKIYASTMSEDALVYRHQRGLDKLDEQMALLVQRVSGAYHGKYFFPDVSGVGVSYNTYVWQEEMDPRAGMLRLVLGLGTRAVNRVEGDYPRIAALDRPLRRPHGNMDDLVKFSQHDVDLINVKDNCFQTMDLKELLAEGDVEEMKIARVADREMDLSGGAEAPPGSWVVTFDELLSAGGLADRMRGMMKRLEKEYNYAVDVEFTLNFMKDGGYRINLLQCRPLQTRGFGKRVEMPAKVRPGDVFFSTKGHFFGGNISQSVDKIVYVRSNEYISLGIPEKHEAARIIGRVNRKIASDKGGVTILLGPGRWGTAMPSMGIPVTFSEINHMSVLGEIAFPKGNLMPDLSFGTHFFQDLVETGIFYLAIFPDKEDVVFSDKRLGEMEDIFPKMFPEFPKYKGVISLYDTKVKGLKIMSDVVSQGVICFFS